MNTQPHIPIDHLQISRFCRKWRILEFSLFGSVLRDDFRPDSDIDVMVQFEPQAPWSLLDLVAAAIELKQLFGREVELIEKDAITNPFRRQSILRSHQVIYAA